MTRRRTVTPNWQKNLPMGAGQNANRQDNRRMLSVAEIAARCLAEREQGASSRSCHSSVAVDVRGRGLRRHHDAEDSDAARDVIR